MVYGEMPTTVLGFLSGLWRLSSLWSKLPKTDAEKPVERRKGNSGGSARFMGYLARTAVLAFLTPSEPL